MILAFLMNAFSPYGHPRRMFRELNKLFGQEAYLYFSERWRRFASDIGGKSRSLTFYKQGELYSTLEGILRNTEIDALILVDIEEELLKDLRCVLSRFKRLEKKIIFYHPSSWFRGVWVEDISFLANRGVKFLWEHEIGYLMAARHLPSHSNLGFLPTPRDLIEREIAERHDVSFPGRFEEDKGASVFLKVLPYMLDRGWKVRADLLGKGRHLCVLARYHKGIELRRKVDQVFGVFIKETFSTKLLFLPYDPYLYSLASSGLLREAMIYGIPVVITEGCWLSYYLEKHNGAGVFLKNRIDVDEIIGKLEVALKEYGNLKEKALRTVDRVREECSSENFKKMLLYAIGSGRCLGAVDSQLPSFEIMLKRAESHFWYDLAINELSKEKLCEAEECLRKSLSYDPFNSKALLLKSRLLVKRGRHKEALSLLEKLEKHKLISPSILTQIYVEKAKILYISGKTVEYRASLNKIKENKDYLTFESLNDLMELLEEEEGEIISRLLKDVNSVVELPLLPIFKLRYAVDGMWLSFLLKERVNFGKYLNVFQRELEVCELSEEMIESIRIRKAIWHLVNSLLTKKWRTEAKVILGSLYKKADIMAPVFLYNLASLYKRVGELERSKNLFSRVLSSGKQELYGGAYYHLGEIALREGKLGEAKNNFRMCLKILPEHERARQKLAGLEGAKEGGENSERGRYFCNSSYF